MWAMGHKQCLIAAAVVSRRHSAGILGTTRASAFLKGRKLASLGHVLLCKVVTAAFLQGCMAKCLLGTACSGAGELQSHSLQGRTKAERGHEIYAGSQSRSFGSRHEQGLDQNTSDPLSV